MRIPLLALIALTLFGRAMSFGLGIDWGVEFHKSTTLLPKSGFKMVENQISKRKTPSSISFCGEERIFENQAVVKFTRQNCETYHYLTRYLEGVNGTLLKQFPDFERYFLDTALPIFDKKSAVFKTNFPLTKEFQRNHTSWPTNDTQKLPENFFRLEEILGMMIEMEKENAEKTGETKFGEAVFTIWDNSISIPARKIYASACHLAGLKPAGFVHENTAAAVYYSTDRKPVSPTESEIYLFINTGSFGTKLSLIDFNVVEQKGLGNTTFLVPAVTVLKDKFDSSFSGHLLDICLGEYALEKQLKSLNRKIKDEENTIWKRRRLFIEAKRVKEILSANKEIPFYVEDFFEDRHLNVKISRTEFEENCGHIFDKLKTIIKDFSKEGKKATKLEVLGGVFRVPKVQEILREVTGLTLGVHINGDEGMAYGAAFISANNTAGIKTKKIFSYDGPNYEIDITIKFNDTSSTPKTTTLFPFKTPYGTKKKMNIKRLAEDIQLKLSQKNEDYFVEYRIEGAAAAIEKYKQKNLTDWKVDLYLELDPLGIPKLTRTDIQIKESVAEIFNKTLPKTNKTDNKTTNDTNATSSAPEVVSETRYKIVVHNERLKLSTIGESYQGLSDDKDAFEESKALLRNIREKEDAKKKLSEIKNKLESYVYKLGADSNDPDVNRFLSGEEQQKFKDKSTEIDNFLFSDEAQTAELKQFTDMVRGVEAMLNPLNYRRGEHREKGTLWAWWENYWQNVTKGFEELKKSKPWITDDKIEETKKKIEGYKDTIEDLYKQQEAKSLFENPVFTTHDVAENVKYIGNALDRLSRTPKPKLSANLTDDLDKFMSEDFKKMNHTDSNFTKEQLDELMEKFKEFQKNNPLSGNDTEPLDPADFDAAFSDDEPEQDGVNKDFTNEEVTATDDVTSDDGESLNGDTFKGDATTEEVPVDM